MEKLSLYQRYLFEEEVLLQKGRWRLQFPNRNEKLMLEIGCGKGGYLLQQAEAHPHINYIGIERNLALLLGTLKKIEESSVSNLLFCGFHAFAMEEYFAEGEVDRIYLNFSDPWPKNRNAKRRLTSRSFLDRYSRILSGRKELHFKTDNRELFEFSLMQLSARGDLLTALDLDLHSRKYEQGDERSILTEYERKFMEMGLVIYRLEANLQ